MQLPSRELRDLSAPEAKALSEQEIEVKIDKAALEARGIVFCRQCGKEMAIAQGTSGKPSTGLCRDCGKPNAAVGQFDADTGEIVRRSPRQERRGNKRARKIARRMKRGG